MYARRPNGGAWTLPRVSFRFRCVAESNMALFECCSKQFVKDTGRTTLHPVLDLNSSARSNILCVVMKKKSRYFWKAIKYSPTPFTLNDLLTKPVDVSSLGIEPSEFVTQYKNEPKFHVNGKLGAKIATEFGIDVSAIDSFTVSMDIGTVTKKEASWKTLNSLLSDTAVNLDLEFVQYVLSRKRKSLCVVYETVTTRGDLDLNADSQVEGDASVSAGKPKFFISLSGSIQETHHRSFELPGNTVLGFACYELNIDSDTGTLQLALDDVTDAPDRIYHIFDEPDGQSDRALQAVFDDLLKSSQHSQIVESFMKILSFPKAIPALRDLLEDALSSAEEGGQKPHAVVDFKARAGEGFESCKDLLTLVGFMTQQSKDGDKIHFPKDSSLGLLTCCTGLGEALVELSAPQCQALQQVTFEYIEPLLYLLKNALYGKSTPADDPLLQRVWIHSTNPAKTFLLTLGFEQVTEGDRKVLRLDWNFEDTFLEDCYVSLFVLCSKH